MHILLSSPYHFSAYTGGNEQYTHQLATGLTQAGHQVTYLTGWSKPQTKTLYRLVTVSLKHLTGKPLPSFNFITQAKKVKADVYHAAGHDLTALTLGTALSGLPKVMTYQGNNHPTHPILGFISQLPTQLIPKLFDAIITTSPRYQKQLQQRWPNRSVTHIPLMISPHVAKPLKSKIASQKKLNFNSNQKHLLCVAKLDRHQYYKGIDVLLKTMPLLPKNYVLHLVGDGDQRANYQQFSQALKVSHRCVFHGQVANQDLAHYYKAADVCILPSTSDSEGFGLVLIEAMRQNTPTLTTTAIGPATWYQHAKVTQLVPPHNHQALATSIQQIISQPDSDRLQRAYQFSLQFSLEAMVNHTISIYQSLLSNSLL